MEASLPSTEIVQMRIISMTYLQFIALLACSEYRSAVAVPSKLAVSTVSPTIVPSKLVVSTGIISCT